MNRRTIILFGLQLFCVGLLVGAGAGACGYSHFAKSEETKKRATMYPVLRELGKPFSTRGHSEAEEFPEMPHVSE